MKKLITSLVFLTTIFAFTACDLNSSVGTDLLDQDGNIVAAEEAAPEAQPESAPAPSRGYGGFLWKPVSESSGNLVILTPHTTHGRTKGRATISGSFGSESASMRGEDDNGNRPHFYFNRPGSSYGRNITVQVPLTDGSVYSVVVPNGSQRFEQ